MSGNTEKRFDRDRGNARNFQYYGQMIINTLFRTRPALGAAPSYLYNSDLDSPDTRDILAVGVNVQFYVNRVFSLLAEWIPEVSGESAAEHEPAASGFELETSGHFFKIVAADSVYLNSRGCCGSELALACR